MAYQTDKANDRARSLRKGDTVAEQKLWEVLRNRRLGGLKFVRQLPIGRYFADFACRQMKFVVEVDGATHSEAHEQAHDAKREAFMLQQGWVVLRCWNHDVFKNISGVCDSILIVTDRR